MARRRLLPLSLTAALIAASTTIASPSAPRPPPAAAHLFLVRADTDAAVALALTSARVVARYEAATLVEAEDEDAARLARAGAGRRDYMREVRLGTESLDPATDRPPLAGKHSTPDGPGLAVIQFVGPIQDRWRETLAATGVRTVSYLAQNAYLVHGTAAELKRLAALRGAEPSVRAVIAYTARDKLGRGVHDVQRIAVQTVSGAAGAQARSGLARRDTSAITAVGAIRTQRVRSTDPVAIAQDPGVIAVLPDPEPVTLDERQNQIVAGNLTGTDLLVPTGPGYLAFLDGFGLGTATFPFTVDVADAGLDKGVVPAPAGSHRDFFEEGDNTKPSRITYAQEATAADVDARDCGGHGTAVASVIGGFNTDAGAATEDAAGFQYGLGVAPRARLGATKLFNCAGSYDVTTSVSALAGSAYASGARISTNSLGAAVSGAYNASAQELDALVRDARSGEAGNQELVEIVSAGNSGPGADTINAPGTAKNVITVGASESVRTIGATDGCGVTDTKADDARDLIDFTSRGPTNDGRTKPDVVGPGTHVVGAQPQVGADYNGSGTCNPQFPAGSTLYALTSGTSQATAAVAGIAALVREWYRQKRGAGVASPSPALTKAIIANSASDLKGGANGAGGTNAPVPSQDQGWGLPSISRALDGGARFFRDQQDVFGASGGTPYVKVLKIDDPAKPTRVTLAFTDAPGPTTGNAYVNDLDLEVATGAGTHKGNRLDGGVSLTDGDADPRNNLESVYLTAGASGSIAVRVIPTNIAGDGVPGNADASDQDFALVASNVTETPGGAPVLSRKTLTATPSGDGDANFEPGEIFALAAELENVGDAGASGVAGTLSGAAPVKALDTTAGWPDIPVGSARSNADPLTARVDFDATCGATYALSLDITTAQGVTSTVPVAVTTGVTGAPVALSSADVPKAIPDAPAAGATSTLAVGASGIVRDVNVRIGDITHAFVGDLVLTLTSPSGTAVVLADRVGGSGDNYVDTVFDDEAATSITAGAAPFTGSFRPGADQLSRFDGESQQGAWKLTVLDSGAGDLGTLNSWGHSLTPAVCDYVPAEPGAVGGLTATGGDRTIALAWDAATSATDYELFRRSASGTYPSAPSAAPVGTSLTDTGLEDSATYCYQVRATNGGRAGPLSAEVCAATRAAPGTPGPGPAATPSPSPAATLDLSRVPARLRLNRKRRVSITITATGGGAGRLRLASSKKLRPKPRARKRRITFAAPRFSATGSVKVTLRLSRANVRVLRRAKRVGCALTASLAAQRASRNVTLLPPRTMKR